MHPPPWLTRREELVALAPASRWGNVHAPLAEYVCRPWRSLRWVGLDSAVSPPIVTQIAPVAAALDPAQPDPLPGNGDGVPCKPSAPHVIFHSVRHPYSPRAATAQQRQKRCCTQSISRSNHKSATTLNSVEMKKIMRFPSGFFLSRGRVLLCGPSGKTLTFVSGASRLTVRGGGPCFFVSIHPAGLRSSLVIYGSRQPFLWNRLLARTCLSLVPERKRECLQAWQ